MPRKPILTTQKKFTKHQLVCSRGTLATCLECDEVFRRDEIIHHLAQIHGVSVTSNGLFGQRKILSKEPKSKNSGHLCGHCEKTFKTKREFIAHQRMEHEIKEDKKLNFECKICSKRFRRPYLLREHMMVHSKSAGFQCSKCGATFRLVRIFV